MSKGNASEICLNERQMLLSANQVEMVVLGYLVPLLILFGVTGNLINLTVLMAKGMKTRSNTLLATLAIADMAFLLFMLPHCMAHYKWLAFNNIFRQFYFTSKMHLIAFLNWSSAAAIWLILTICMERLIGIRYPLSVRKHRAKHTHLLILGIVMFTGLLTFTTTSVMTASSSHFVIALKYTLFVFLWTLICKWPKNISNTHSNLLRYYVRWSQPINAVFVVFLPTVVVVLSNILLIHTLRQRQKLLLCSTHENIVSVSALPSNLVSRSSLQAKQAQSSSLQIRVEHKVTFTVCAIVSCFTITQAPSAIVTLATGFIEIDISKYQMHLITITTFMIAVGKSLNFVLFCLSSANFRQRLMAMMKARFDKSNSNRRNADTDVNSTLITRHTDTSLRNSFKNAKKKCCKALSLNTAIKDNRPICSIRWQKVPQSVQLGKNRAASDL
uniref:G-protein coupled receptors family 1 profile domain-containing protein n=1 Tax=Ditylenchus dipsaci TaxID=166011 RepID=A0A915CR06_9BILA